MTEILIHWFFSIAEVIRTASHGCVHDSIHTIGMITQPICLNTALLAAPSLSRE